MKPNDSIVISVVAPLTEAPSEIAAAIGEISAVLATHWRFFEIILIDDSAGGRSRDQIKRLSQAHSNLRIYSLEGEVSTNIAILAGLDASMGDFVVTLIPGVDPPSLIPELIEKARGIDSPLIGVAPSPRESLPRRTLSHAFYTYCSRSLGLKLIKGATPYQVLNRRIVNTVIRLRERNRDLRAFLSSSGADTQTFSYTPLRERKPQPLLDRIGSSIDLLFSNSTHPLRAISWIGIGASTLSLMYGVYTCLVYLFLDKTVPGWTTLSLVLSAMFFFFFLIVAAFAEYMGRMFIEIQGRPLYTIVKEESSPSGLDAAIQKNVVHDSQ